MYKQYLLMDAMPTVTSNNREPISLGMFLYHRTNITVSYTWFYWKYKMVDKSDFLVNNFIIMIRPVKTEEEYVTCPE